MGPVTSIWDYTHFGGADLCQGGLNGGKSREGMGYFPHWDKWGYLLWAEDKQKCPGVIAWGIYSITVVSCACQATDSFAASGLR
jgi:hypothetical protein